MHETVMEVMVNVLGEGESKVRHVKIYHMKKESLYAKGFSQVEVYQIILQNTLIQLGTFCTVNPFIHFV